MNTKSGDSIPKIDESIPPKRFRCLYVPGSSPRVWVTYDTLTQQFGEMRELQQLGEMRELVAVRE